MSIPVISGKMNVASAMPPMSFAWMASTLPKFCAATPSDKGSYRRFTHARGRDDGGLAFPSKYCEIIGNPQHECVERLPSHEGPLLLTGQLVKVVQDVKTPRYFLGRQDDRLIHRGEALLVQLFQRFDCMGHLAASAFSIIPLTARYCLIFG
jgi:hypothetical protein